MNELQLTRTQLLGHLIACDADCTEEARRAAAKLLAHQLLNLDELMQLGPALLEKEQQIMGSLV